MQIRPVLLSLVTALALAWAVTPAFAAPQAELVAAWRQGAESALLDATGHIYVYGRQEIERTVTLTANGHPFLWRHTPTGFARWNSEWLVADGTNQIRRFATNGVFLAAFSVPTNAFDFAAAGTTLWIANHLAPSAQTRLWSSTDGRRFTALSLDEDRTEDPFALAMRAQTILTGSSSGELYVAHIIDAPVVRRVFPRSKLTRWPVAYSRSRSRALLEYADPGIDDLTLYSSPVRDLLAIGADELVVLRNREDVRTSRGMTTQQGLRADRYTGGRHVASAIFPEPMKWILRSDAKHVTAVTKTGVVRVGEWGRPIAGGIAQ
jgi:hypothetical protein